MTKLPAMKTTLEKIARLYDLTAEMRQIVQELNEVNVEVSISKFNRWGGSDPLDAAASIMVMMRPGCDLVQK